MNKNPVIFDVEVEKIENDYVLTVKSVKTKTSFQKRLYHDFGVLDEAIKMLLLKNYYIVKTQISKTKKIRIKTLKG